MCYISPYEKWYERLRISDVKDGEVDEVKLEDFKFDGVFLSFKLVRYISKQIPIRWKTQDYERYPVQWKKSIRASTIFKKAKTINLERFCEVELFNYDIPPKFKRQILSKLNYTPVWRQKEIDIEKKQKEIETLFNQKSPLNNIEQILIEDAKPFDNEVMTHKANQTKIKTNKTPLWSLVIRALLTIPTLGFCWLGFIGIKKAKKNQQYFDELEKKITSLELTKFKTLANRKQELLDFNTQVINKNEKIEQKIIKLNEKIQEIKTNDYSYCCDDDGFIDFRKTLLTITKFEKKGVYIIWNKTKNKYYVGQSKDVYKRLFTQHFVKANVKNIIFAKDWYEGDEFFYKLIELQTKDELDSIEKEYIERYDAFKNGYSNTGGNI